MSFHIKAAMRSGIRTGFALALVGIAVFLALGIRPVCAQTADTLDTNAKIKIVTAGEPTLSGDFTVDTNGDITMLYINQVHVKGLTVAQARNKIAAGLGKFIRDPQVVVTLVSYGGVSVEVSGAVAQQGPHLLRSDAHLNDLMQLARPSIDAELAKLEITHGRPGEAHSKQTINYLSFLNQKADDGNPPLQDGDVVFVPAKTLLPIDVNIRGEVVKPGRVTVPQKTTVADVIQAAGGIAVTGDRKGISIQHASTTEAIPFDYEAAREQPGNTAVNPVLLDGDTIMVKALQHAAVYTITGGVVHPAEYPITEAAVSLSDAIGRAGGTSDHAHLDQTSIVRAGANGQPEVIKVNAKDLALQARTYIQPGDRIDIPPGNPSAPSMGILGIISTLATVAGLATVFRRH